MRIIFTALVTYNKQNGSSNSFMAVSRGNRRSDQRTDNSREQQQNGRFCWPEKYSSWSLQESRILMGLEMRYIFLPQEYPRGWRASKNHTSQSRDHGRQRCRHKRWQSLDRAQRCHLMPVSCDRRRKAHWTAFLRLLSWTTWNRLPVVYAHNLGNKQRAAMKLLLLLLKLGFQQTTSSTHLCLSSFQTICWSSPWMQSSRPACKSPKDDYNVITCTCSNSFCSWKRCERDDDDHLRREVADDVCKIATPQCADTLICYGALEALHNAFIGLAQSSLLDHLVLVLDQKLDALNGCCRSLGNRCRYSPHKEVYEKPIWPFLYGCCCHNFMILQSWTRQF